MRIEGPIPISGLVMIVIFPRAVAKERRIARFGMKALNLKYYAPAAKSFSTVRRLRGEEIGSRIFVLEDFSRMENKDWVFLQSQNDNPTPSAYLIQSTLLALSTALYVLGRKEVADTG